MNIFLIILTLFSLFSLLFYSNNIKIFKEPAFYSLFFLAAMYVLYTAAGLFANIDFKNAVSLYGGMGLLNIFMMYVSVRVLLNKPEDVYNLEKVFVVLCLLMAIYGIIRLPFGGDPANYYGLYEKKKAQLTFFDFSQAALFCVAFVMVFLRQVRRPMKSMLGSVMILLFLANIVLSYRRAAWIGLVLVFLWFLFTVNVKRKILMLALGFMVFTVGAAIFTSRFAVSEGKEKAAAHKTLTADITDKHGQISVKTGRFSELYAAVVATNSVSPLIGLGPWGLNTDFTISHGRGPASFVHSSIVHVYLKMGLLGLVAYLVLLVGFPLWWLKVRRRIWNDQRLRSIGEAFFCGYLFWLPEIFFSTPLIIFRQTQLLALFFAVPAAAWAIDSRMQLEKKGRVIAPVLVALAVFIVAQSPGLAVAATDNAPKPEVSTFNEPETLLLQTEISIGMISETTISPTLIGTNLHVGYERDIDSKPKKNHLMQWQLGGKMILNREMINHCRNVGVKILRYPGGETSNAYHWREGVGPVHTRPVGKDEYGTAMKQFLGTLEFAAAAKAIGAEMLITVNYKTGTLQEAANWVEYCNGTAPAGTSGWGEHSYAADEAAPAGYFAWLRGRHGYKEPLGVKYWEIGNEIYFHKDSSYVAKSEQYSRLMKKKDPSIKIGLSSDSLLYMSPKAIQNLKISSESFDFLSVHYYGVLKTRLPMTNFYSNAESSRSFVVDKADTYTISIEASGSKALQWPHMSLEVNGAPIQDFTVTSTDLQQYTANAQLNQGANTLTLKFDNDRYLPGIGDTNLYVQGVTIATSKGRPIEIWHSHDLEYAWLFSNNGLIEEHIWLLKSAFPNHTLMITEGNTGYGIIQGLKDAEESRKLKAGIWMAGLLNSLIRNNVSSFAQWGLYGSHMGFALVWPDGHVSPSYFVLKMYSIHAGQRRVDLVVTSPTFDAPLLATTPFGKATTGNPFVDAVASLNEEGNELAVTIVNRHASSAMQAQMPLGDLRLAVPEANLYTLKAKNNEGMEANNVTVADNVNIRTKIVQFETKSESLTFTLEPSSVTTLRCKILR